LPFGGSGPVTIEPMKNKKIIKPRPPSSAALGLLSMASVSIYPAAFLWLSGDWLWVEGWIFTLWFFTLCGSVLFYLVRHDPALLRERFQKPGAANDESWDRIFICLLMGFFLAWILLMPLDAKRFGWSGPFPLGLQLAGGAGMILSFFFIYRSYTDNPFLSPLVRFQKERKQKLVSTGVYGFVRHPMYLGAIAWFLGMPLMAGSWAGMGIGVILTAMLVGRIFGEEKMLARKLKGYAAYRTRVKWRLVPLVF
jgi:protein-S-isoprenylcysteine O-methyltransferase Ste14